mmetsp:Transcript_50122/g.144398  ORF Transcript_50122/g.144398 Transcript_50122/m.144398 type:complete len:238 (-) Transcript_50122:1898-2611(-)
MIGRVPLRHGQRRLVVGARRPRAQGQGLLRLQQQFEHEDRARASAAQTGDRRLHLQRELARPDEDLQCVHACGYERFARAMGPELQGEVRVRGGRGHADQPRRLELQPDGVPSAVRDHVLRVDKHLLVSLRREHIRRRNPRGGAEPCCGAVATTAVVRARYQSQVDHGRAAQLLAHRATGARDIVQRDEVAASVQRPDHVRVAVRRDLRIGNVLALVAHLKPEIRRDVVRVHDHAQV